MFDTPFTLSLTYDAIDALIDFARDYAAIAVTPILCRLRCHAIYFRFSHLIIFFFGSPFSPFAALRLRH